MNENVKKMLERLATDSELRANIFAQKDAQSAYALACEAVPGYSLEEFTAAIEAVCRAAEGELSAEQLGAVSGGGQIYDGYAPEDCIPWAWFSKQANPNVILKYDWAKYLEAGNFEW